MTPKLFIILSNDCNKQIKRSVCARNRTFEPGHGKESDFPVWITGNIAVNNVKFLAQTDRLAS